jgi:hypothetical protein
MIYLGYYPFKQKITIGWFIEQIYNRYVKLYENSNVLNKKIVHTLRPIQINGSDKDSGTSGLRKTFLENFSTIGQSGKWANGQMENYYEKVFRKFTIFFFRLLNTTGRHLSFVTLSLRSILVSHRGQSGNENYYEKLFSKIYDYFVFYDEG